MKLLDLPPEVLNMVFETIMEGEDHSSEERAMAALCRTSRQCYAIARRVLYLSLSFCSRNSLKLVARSLAADPNIATLIQILRVNLYPERRTSKITATPSVLHMFTHIKALSLYDFHDIIDHLPHHLDLFPLLVHCNLENGTITHLAALMPLWMAPQLKVLRIVGITRGSKADTEAGLDLLASDPVRSPINWLYLGDLRNFSTKEAHALARLRRIRKVDLKLFDVATDAPATKLINCLSPNLEEFFFQPSAIYGETNLPELGSMTSLKLLGVSGLHLIYAIESRGDSLPKSLEELDVQAFCELLPTLYALLEDIVQNRNRCTPNLQKLKLWCPSALTHAQGWFGPDIVEINGASDIAGIDLSGLKQHQQLRMECERMGIMLVIEDWDGDDDSQ